MTTAALLESDLEKSPFRQFGRWFEEARQRETMPDGAMTVSTCGSDGIVSSRTALLKGFDEHGFVFYTNYNSRKGTQISENPRLSLCFYWPTLDEQIRIEGTVTRLPADESDAYFNARPRGSQLGAWASEQSTVLPSRETLEAKYRAIEERFTDRPVPRPPFWGGFRLAPTAIEFWYGRPDRLHDRVLYTRAADGWQIARLYP